MPIGAFISSIVSTVGNFVMSGKLTDVINRGCDIVKKFANWILPKGASTNERLYVTNSPFDEESITESEYEELQNVRNKDPSKTKLFDKVMNTLESHKNSDTNFGNVSGTWSIFNTERHQKFDGEKEDEVNILNTTGYYNSKLTDGPTIVGGRSIGFDNKLSLLQNNGGSITIKTKNITSELSADGINNAPVAETFELNDKNPIKIVNGLLEGPLYEVQSFGQIINELKTIFGVKRKDVENFGEKIKLIWGIIGGPTPSFKKVTFIGNVQSTTSLNTVQSAAALKTTVLGFNRSEDGDLILDNFVEGGQNRLSTSYHLTNIRFNSKSTLGLDSYTSGSALNGNPNSYLNKQEESDKVVQNNVPFSLIQKHEIINLARKFFENDKNFEKLLLKTVYRFRHCNGLIPVFKKGELCRFIKKSNLNDLKDDEEYEENKYKLI